MAWERFRHHRLVGTTVDVEVLGGDGPGIDAAVAAEMQRLERVFSAFDPDSELSRWKRDELDVPSPELAHVMAVALDWQLRSGGRFNPLAGVVSARWREAAEQGEPPGDDELAALAATIVEPRYRIEDGVPIRTGDCDDLDLNAIAKGAIVDLALARADGLDVEALVVNAGGDLAHRGATPITVAVENPLRPYDNEPPLSELELSNGAVATSGGSRRPLVVGGRRYSHVVDPRTGRTVDHIASITVVAHDALTADVAATVLGAVAPTRALDEARGLGVDCLIVEPDGSTFGALPARRPGP